MVLSIFHFILNNLEPKIKNLILENIDIDDIVNNTVARGNQALNTVSNVANSINEDVTNAVNNIKSRGNTEKSIYEMYEEILINRKEKKRNRIKKMEKLDFFSAKEDKRLIKNLIEKESNISNDDKLLKMEDLFDDNNEKEEDIDDLNKSLLKNLNKNLNNNESKKTVNVNFLHKDFTDNNIDKYPTVKNILKVLNPEKEETYKNNIFKLYYNSEKANIYKNIKDLINNNNIQNMSDKIKNLKKKLREEKKKSNDYTDTDTDTDTDDEDEANMKYNDEYLDQEVSEDSDDDLDILGNLNKLNKENYYVVFGPEKLEIVKIKSGDLISKNVFMIYYNKIAEVYSGIQPKGSEEDYSRLENFTNLIEDFIKLIEYFIFLINFFGIDSFLKLLIGDIDIIEKMVYIYKMNYTFENKIADLIKKNCFEKLLSIKKHPKYIVEKFKTITHSIENIKDAKKGIIRSYCLCCYNLNVKTANVANTQNCIKCGMKNLYINLDNEDTKEKKNIYNSNELVLKMYGKYNFNKKKTSNIKNDDEDVLFNKYDKLELNKFFISLLDKDFYIKLSDEMDYKSNNHFINDVEKYFENSNSYDHKLFDEIKNNSDELTKDIEFNIPCNGFRKYKNTGTIISWIPKRRKYLVKVKEINDQLSAIIDKIRKEPLSILKNKQVKIIRDSDENPTVQGGGGLEFGKGDYKGIPIFPVGTIIQKQTRAREKKKTKFTYKIDSIDKTNYSYTISKLPKLRSSSEPITINIDKARLARDNHVLLKDINGKNFIVLPVHDKKNIKGKFHYKYFLKELKDGKIVGETIRMVPIEKMLFTKELKKEALKLNIKESIKLKIEENPKLLHNYENAFQKELEKLKQNKTEYTELINELEKKKNPIEAFWDENNHYEIIEVEKNNVEKRNPENVDRKRRLMLTKYDDEKKRYYSRVNLITDELPIIKKGKAYYQQKINNISSNMSSRNFFVKEFEYQFTQDGDWDEDVEKNGYYMILEEKTNISQASMNGGAGGSFGKRTTAWGNKSRSGVANVKKSSKKSTVEENTEILRRVNQKNLHKSEADYALVTERDIRLANDMKFKIKNNTHETYGNFVNCYGIVTGYNENKYEMEIIIITNGEIKIEKKIFEKDILKYLNCSKIIEEEYDVIRDPKYHDNKLLERQSEMEEEAEEKAAELQEAEAAKAKAAELQEAEAAAKAKAEEAKAHKEKAEEEVEEQKKKAEIAQAEAVQAEAEIMSGKNQRLRAEAKQKAEYKAKEAAAALKAAAEAKKKAQTAKVEETKAHKEAAEKAAERAAVVEAAVKAEVLKPGAMIKKELMVEDVSILPPKTKRDIENKRREKKKEKNKKILEKYKKSKKKYESAKQYLVKENDLILLSYNNINPQYYDGNNNDNIKNLLQKSHNTFECDNEPVIFNDIEFNTKRFKNHPIFDKITNIIRTKILYYSLENLDSKIGNYLTGIGIDNLRRSCFIWLEKYYNNNEEFKSEINVMIFIHIYIQIKKNKENIKKKNNKLVNYSDYFKNLGIIGEEILQYLPTKGLGKTIMNGALTIHNLLDQFADLDIFNAFNILIYIVSKGTPSLNGRAKGLFLSLATFAGWFYKMSQDFEEICTEPYKKRKTRRELINKRKRQTRKNREQAKIIGDAVTQAMIENNKNYMIVEDMKN